MTGFSTASLLPTDPADSNDSPDSASGAYRVDPDRLPGIRRILEGLEGAERVVLTTHVNADGDGTGSQAAVLALLEARGVQVRVVNPTPFPDLFRFLLPDRAADGGPPVLPASSTEAATFCRHADRVVVLDTGELPRIGRVKPMVEHLPHLIIDHHPEGDRVIPGEAWREVGAAATGEMVFDLLHVALGGGPPAVNRDASAPSLGSQTVAGWTPQALEGIYTAILTDTGSFRFSNSTPRVHRVVAEVIAAGVSPDVLHDRIYGSAPLRRYKLLEAALGTLEQSASGEVAWMTVPDTVFRALGCDAADLEGLTDYPRTLAGAEVAILFRPVDDGIKISLRSNGAVDVNAVAREFGGGGHVRAAGALLSGPLSKARTRVVAAVESALNSGGQGGGQGGGHSAGRQG